MDLEKHGNPQLAAALLVGGLAPAASAAAWGWQGAAVAAVVILPAGWWLLRLLSKGGLPTGWRGRMTQGVYALWGALLMSRGLGRCAGRMELTGGGGAGTALWIALLLTLFLLWVGRKGPGAFFRGAALIAPAVLAVLAAVLLWGGCRGTWRWSAGTASANSFWVGLECAGGLLFALPYINEGRSGKLALAGAGGAAAGAAMAGVTGAVLSPAVAGLVAEPFFAMTACLGTSARVEGLVSALWLGADLLWLGLLARGAAWPGRGEKLLPAGVTLLAFFLRLLGVDELFPPAFWGIGTAVLWAITLGVLLPGAKNSGQTGNGGTTSCG